MNVLRFVHVLPVLFVVSTSAPIFPPGSMYQMDVPKKCCISGYIFDENFRCVRVENESDRSNHLNSFMNSTDYYLDTVLPMYAIVCLEDSTLVLSETMSRTYATIFVPREFCIETMTNGSEVLARCPTWPSITTRNGFDGMHNSNTTRDAGDITTVIFWGAQTYMTTNMAHVIFCVIVVVIYLSVPALGKGLYNRAVLRHNVCLLSNGCILSFLGYCDLCDCKIYDNLTIFLWLALQYFTIATVFWLNVICFDMTLSITRFRWMLGSGQRTEREENQKLLCYGVFAWGGALLPVGLAGILEYAPGVPADFPMKPNYLRFRNGPSVVVNLYFFCIPLLTLFCNNVLFVFTTYKILRIQRSTEIATKSNTNVLRKKYFLFLRLYLLMGAPWFFGSLFACLNKLATLKICRLIQPTLWLLMLVTHKKFRRKVAEKLCRARNEEQHRATTTNR